MVEVIITLKNGKKPFIETWKIDNRECFSVKNDGITIYESDGSFRAYYYAHSVISIEVKDVLGDS